MKRAATAGLSRRAVGLGLAALVLASALCAGVRAGAGPEPIPALPARLSETGLFVAGSVTRVDPRNLAYAPQYPLWSDGAQKRRFVRIPEGATIDASDPEHWQFPVGTRFWKEFSFGRRVETRYIERIADGSFRYASYVWSQDGRDALLSPQGQSVELAEGGRHEVPAESDCRNCHEGTSARILGFGALQLSHDRDPFAPHREAVTAGMVDLRELIARGLLAGQPAQWVQAPPRIESRSARERASLGYLHANCGGCHNATGPLASLGLDFEQRVGKRAAGAPRSILPSALSVPSRFAIPDAQQSLRIAPRRPDMSAVVYRMGSRFSATQMPPLGTQKVDAQALELITQWITHDLGEVEGQQRWQGETR